MQHKNAGQLRLVSDSTNLALPYSEASYVMHSSGYGWYPGSTLKYETDWTFKVEDDHLRAILSPPRPKAIRCPHKSGRYFAEEKAVRCDACGQFLPLKGD